MTKKAKNFALYAGNFVLFQRKLVKYTEDVPVELRDVMDKTTFEKSRLYQLDRSFFGSISGTYSQIETTVGMKRWALAKGSIPNHQLLLFNQSILSINQSTNQPTNQSINQSLIQFIRHAFYRCRTVVTNNTLGGRRCLQAAILLCYSYLVPVPTIASISWSGQSMILAIDGNCYNSIFNR